MREAGPVSKVFENQQVGLEGQNDTKPYIPTARTLLGQLKNRMEQGGLGSGRMVRDLEDGTRIIVTSVLGQDKIHIIAPSAEHPERVEPEYPIPVPTIEVPDVPTPPLEIDAFYAAACGYINIDTAHAQAVIWKTLDAEPTVICDEAVALAISDNGQCVVGYRGERALGNGVPFRWTNAGGVMDIPGMDPDNPLGAATCVNATGTVVGGYGRREGGETRAWVWTPEGTEDLPDEGLGASVTCISPNGMWAAGTMNTPLYGPTPDASVNQRAIVWYRNENGGWSYSLPPRPAGSSERQRLQGPSKGPRPNSYFPVNITNAGVATIYEDNMTGFTASQIDNYQQYHESTFPFIPEYGETAQPGKDYVYPDIWYGNHLPLAHRVYFYDAAGTLTQLLTDSTPTACADDTRTVVGHEGYGVFVSRQYFPWVTGHHIYFSDGSHATDMYTWRFSLQPWYSIHEGDSWTRAWWWSELSGKVYLSPDGALAYDISEDGLVIVGAVGTGVEKVPSYWMRQRGPDAIPMQLGPGQYGEAHSVARPRTPKAEHGGAPPIIPA